MSDEIKLNLNNYFISYKFFFLIKLKNLPRFLSSENWIFIFISPYISGSYVKGRKLGQGNEQ